MEKNNNPTDLEKEYFKNPSLAIKKQFFFEKIERKFLNCRLHNALLLATLKENQFYEKILIISINLCMNLISVFKISMEDFLNLILKLILSCLLKSLQKIKWPIDLENLDSNVIDYRSDKFLQKRAKDRKTVLSSHCISE